MSCRRTCFGFDEGWPLVSTTSPFRRDVDLLVRDMRTLERRLAEEAAAEQRRQGWLSSYTHVGVHPSGGSGTRRSLTLHLSRKGRWRTRQISREGRSSLRTT